MHLKVIFPRIIRHNVNYLKFTIKNGNTTEIIPVPDKEPSLVIGGEVGDVLELTVSGIDVNNFESGVRSSTWVVQEDDKIIDMNVEQVLDVISDFKPNDQNDEPEDDDPEITNGPKILLEDEPPWSITEKDE